MNKEVINAYWFAVQFDLTDEWGTGSYDFDEAVRMLRKMYPEDEYPDACIAAIANGAYIDDDGNLNESRVGHFDPYCEEEYHWKDIK